MDIEKKNKWMRWGVVVLWMAVIFFFSAQDATDSSAMSGGIVDQLMAMGEGLCQSLFGSAFAFPRDALTFLVRKAAHTSVYFVLAMLVWRCWEKAADLKNLKTLAICFLYAASDELHQWFVPGRSAELRDVCIDTFGAALGLLALAAGRRIFNKE
ncbi:MAG: VanZ family protein [Eubacterium sp.]|nr:VanZ family protein [Eubacterium sp.]